MSAEPTSESSRAETGPTPAARMSVRLYVVVPVRVKEWLEVEGDRSGLSTSAVARQLLTRAYGEASRVA